MEAPEVLLLSASGPTILAPFTGESTSEANLWLDTFKKVMLQQTMGLKPAAQDAHSAKTFAQYVAPGSTAEEWWKALGPAVQGSWNLIQAVYPHKWPRPVPRAPTKKEHWRDFQALALTLDDAIRRVPIPGTGCARSGYLDWADRLESLGEKTTMPDDILVAHVRQNLVPYQIANLLPRGTVDWATFCASVRTLDVEQLELEQAEVQRREENKRQRDDELRAVQDRVTELTRILNDPTQQGRGRGRGTGTYTPPPSYRSREPSQSPMRGEEGWYYRASSNPPVPTTPRFSPRAPQAPLPAAIPSTPRTAPAATPSTPGTRRWGAPVTPTQGTLEPHIGCTRCGKGEHNSKSCRAEPLPEAEQIWREVEKRKAFRTARGGFYTPQAGGRPPQTPQTPETPSPRRPYQQAQIEEFYTAYDEAGSELVYSLDEDEDATYEELEHVYGHYATESPGNVNGASR